MWTPTLLRTGSPVTNRVADAVAAAVAAGAQVVVTTGRTLLTARPVLRELGLIEGHALCSNGAVHIDVSGRKADGGEVGRGVAVEDYVGEVGVVADCFRVHEVRIRGRETVGEHAGGEEPGGDEDAGRAVGA